MIFIFLNGIQGSGKSYIAQKMCDYIKNIKHKKIIIISKDEFRYTKNGYIFDLSTEKIIENNYFNCLIKYINDNYDYIILDNTHFNEDFNLKTLSIIKSQIKIFDYIFVCFKPCDLQWHALHNKHGLTLDDINKRYEGWCNWFKTYYKKEYLLFDLKNRYFTDDEIHRIILNIYK